MHPYSLSYLVAVYVNKINTVNLMMLFFMLILSCNKSPDNVLEDSKENYADSLIVANTAGMRVVGVNETLEYHGDYALDIDADSINDLKIEIADYGSQSFGSFLVVQILSLNTNTTLLVESFPDTTYNLFLHDSTFSGDSTFYFVSYLNSCNKVQNYEPNYLIRDQIFEVEINNVFSNNDSRWKSDTIRLNPSITDRSIREPYEKSIVTYKLHSIDDCHYFSLNKNYYILFKGKSNQMGWILVRLPSQESIDIIEYATQESIQ